MRPKSFKKYLRVAPRRALRESDRSSRPVRPSYALLPVLLVVIGLIVAAFGRVPYYFPLACGTLLAFLIAWWWEGRETKSLIAGLIGGVRSTWPVVSILTLIGGAIAVWTASGTIPAMIDVGLRVSNPQSLVLVAFLSCTAVSMMLGTAIGTVSTIGIALIGVSAVSGLPVGWVAGAVVSGAVIGDRTSPVSSVFHLGVTMTGSQIDRVWRTLLPTTWRAFLLSLGVYTAVTLLVGSNVPLSGPEMPGTGTRTGTGAATPPAVILLLAHFHLPWLTLAPPLLVLLLAAFRVRIGVALLSGIAAGLLLALGVQGVDAGDLVQTILFGYVMPSDVSMELSGGGLLPMAGMMATVVLAGAFYGVMERAGMVDALFERILTRVNRPRAVSLLTMSLSVAVGMVACNQTLSVILPGRMLGGLFDENGLPRERLMQLIADSGVSVAGLIPWNLMALLIQAAIGVPVVQFAPHAVFLWILPLVAIFRIVRRGAAPSLGAPTAAQPLPARRTKM